MSVALAEHDYIVAIEATGRGWVFELHGSIVAFCGRKYANRKHLGAVRGARPRGKRLWSSASRCHGLAWLWDHAHSRLWLTTEPGTRAERFYEEAGWERVGAVCRAERFGSSSRGPTTNEVNTDAGPIE